MSMLLARHRNELLAQQAAVEVLESNVASTPIVTQVDSNPVVAVEAPVDQPKPAKFKKEAVPSVEDK